MKFRLSAERLGSFSARHPWWILGVWLVLLVGSFFSFPYLSGALKGEEMQFLNNPESLRGQRILEEKMDGAALQREVLVIHSDDLTVDDPAFRQVVDRVTSTLAYHSGAVTQIYNYYQASLFDATAAQSLVSSDRHTTILPVALTAEAADSGAALDRYLEAIDEEDTSGFTVATLGQISIQEELSRIAESDMRKTEMIGLPITMLVLIAVFGALVAAGVSLVLALTAISVSIGAIVLIGQLAPQSFFIINVVTMIGLAVGIDYALFIIARYREERQQGLAKSEAIQATSRTANRAVLFSGGTVVLALMGLFIIPITTFRSLGIGAVLVVSIAVLAMLTLVPALLSLLGDRVNWPVVRGPRKLGQGQKVYEAANVFHGLWGKLIEGMMRRPIVGVVLTVVVLLALVGPAFLLKTGAAGGPENLPPGKQRDAYQLLIKDFPAGTLAPVQIVVEGKKTDHVTAAIQHLKAAMASSPDFAASAVVTWNNNNDLALITATLVAETNSAAAYQVIKELREEAVPAAFGALAIPVHVTGQTALNADSTQLTDRLTPAVLAFVLGLTFILLLVVFRSVVVPINAILMNLLSVGAAYGLLVLVFQKGIGHQLFGFQRTVTIDSWVPIFLFCVLFGLSMDYHMFLLSRIHEHYQRTDKSREAVAIGLRATGKVITGAALIMVVVFSTFASGNLVMMQQLGFGLAVAVALDATLIRSVLVPASMALLGKTSWYLPRALEMILPSINVAGGRGQADRSSV